MPKDLAYKLLIILPVMAFFISCEKDKKEVLSFEDIHVVTGINLTDENGAAGGRWNVPNEKVDDLFVFPNPSSGSTFFSSSKSIATLWVLSAECLSENLSETITALSKNLEYNIEEIESRHLDKIDLTVNASTNVVLDFNAYENGFYQVFIQMEDGELLWKNIFIHSTIAGNPDFLDIMNKNCQN